MADSQDTTGKENGTPTKSRAGRLLAGLGSLLGLGALIGPDIGRQRGPDQRTLLREIHPYVGNSVMQQLPNLRAAAKSWRTFQQAYPQLQNIPSSVSLASWLSSNPGVVANPDNALRTMRAFEEYYRYFPEGAKSESIQYQLQTEAQNELAEQGQASHGGSHGGGGHPHDTHEDEENQEQKEQQGQRAQLPRFTRFRKWIFGRTGQGLRGSGSVLARGTSGSLRAGVSAGANILPRLGSLLPGGALPGIGGVGARGAGALGVRAGAAAAVGIGGWWILIPIGIVLVLLLLLSFGSTSQDGSAGVDIDMTGDPAQPEVQGASTKRGEVLQDSTGAEDTSGNGIGNNDDTSGNLEDIIGNYKPARYTITVTVTGSADDVVVRLPLDLNSQLSRASTPCRYIAASVPGVKDEIVWRLAQYQASTKVDFCEGQPNRPTAPNPSPGEASSSAPTSFPLSKFQSYGFPAPQTPNPQKLSGETLARWNTIIKPLAQKAASATNVDIGIIGMWPWLEGSFVPFDNCDKEHNVGSIGDSDHNTQCPYWDGEWQVGLGLHPAYTHMFVKDAFDTMYGGHDNAKVQQIGQQVLNNMKSRYGVSLTLVPNPFPSESIDTIISGSLNGNLRMRNLLTTLMKDEALGVYMVARHFKDNIGVDSGMASQMEGWSSSYYNRQKIVNYIKGIYDAGVTGGSIPDSPSGGTGGIVTAGTYELTVMLLPKPGVDKTFVVNYARADMINPHGGSSTGSTTKPSNSTDAGDESSGTTTGSGCLKVGDPSGNDWAKVNSRNEVIIAKVKEVNQTLGVCVPVNLVKALVYEESGGEMLDPNGGGTGGGYRGIMQVDVNSWCNHGKYDVATLDGNVGCGVEHLAHTYQQCNNSWEGSVTAYYAGHCIPNGAHDNPAEGGSGESDYQYRDRIINRWKMLDSLNPFQ